MSYLILKPKTKREEEVFIELAQLLHVHVEKSEGRTLADIRKGGKEILAWAKEHDKKARRVKVKLSSGDVVAIVNENRRHAQK